MKQKDDPYYTKSNPRGAFNVAEEKFILETLNNESDNIIKYYSDEELEQKLKELENLKAQREKEKKELLDRAKIAYMDKLIADKKNDSQFNQAMNQRIVKMIEGLTSRKDKETKKALEEFLKLFPISNN